MIFGSQPLEMVRPIVLKPKSKRGSSLHPHRESDIFLPEKNMIRIVERKNLLQTVTKLHVLFTASGLTEVSTDLDLTITIVGAFHRWVTCEGHSGVKRAKTMSNYFVRQVMGTPLESIPVSNQYKRLIHKALRLSTCTKSKIYWVSVFSCFRLFKLKPVYDVSTIESGFSGNLIGLLKFSYFRGFITAIQSFRSVVDQNWSATWKWHISGAGGPNGSLAYTQYLNDLRALSHSRVGLACLAMIITLPYVNKWETIKALRDALIDSLEQGDKQAIHSKLSFLSDKGGKTRVIAIVDILSQSCLKTVHQRCNLILRRLKQDGTFDQDRSRRYIKTMSRNGVPLASIDLTAATDRMPVLFQVLVLICLRILTPLQAFIWWTVTVKRDFRYSDGRGNLKHVRYAVGQPMGELSSWPVMAISHHFLVRWSYAAFGRKRPQTASYCVLGDDLTLHGHGVAKIYMHIISCLGMEYSVDKTYIGFGVAEFAKSLFCQGEELTPFPVALLQFRYNTVVSTVLAVMSECKRRNLSLTAQTIVGLYPVRMRALVLLAALSPKSPKSALDLHSREDDWVFQQFMLQQKIRYFSRLNTVRDSTHAFAFNDPGKSGKALASPYLQIALDNGNSYPVRYLKSKDGIFDPEILLGSNWISYNTRSWPNGLPTIGDQQLVPGPTWAKEKDNLVFRSSLVELNKILPGYFTVRCVGKQVGE